MIFLLLFLAAVLLLFVLGETHELTVPKYTVEAERGRQPIKLALVTDLHSCRYGENQQELLDVLAAQHPDAVLLGGDIFDDKLPPEPAKVFVSAVAQAYPTFYVTGNHEYRSKKVPAIKAFVREAGGIVLDGTCHPLTVRGQTIQLCGADDPEGIGDDSMAVQIAQARATGEPDLFTVLLAHRPDLIDQYRNYGCDLVLSGHAHGGQWRIPGLLNGLLAPNQGFFPPYAGGRYDFSDSTLIVSRGLARETTKIPRLFNPPELVIVELV